MAVTTAILSAASTGYSIYANHQASKAASKAEAGALASRPNAETDQMAANRKAIDAQAAQRRKTQGTRGRASTILTGPSGVATPPPATKTLLGL